MTETVARAAFDSRMEVTTGKATREAVTIVKELLDMAAEEGLTVKNSNLEIKEGQAKFRMTIQDPYRHKHDKQKGLLMDAAGLVNSHSGEDNWFFCETELFEREEEGEDDEEEGEPGDAKQTIKRI